MLIKIKQEEFNILDDASLIWTCIEPYIKQMRGKSLDIKTRVSSDMTCGQRALLMFQILYGHTGGGISEFFLHLSYLLSHKGFWVELKNGMRYFDDELMARLLDELEEEYGMQNPEDDPERQARIDRLDERLKQILPDTMKSVASYIRSHPDEFVQFENIS